MQNLNKENIIEFLQKNKPYLHDKYGVESIGLMGSYARDEQTEESDIDFIVEFNKTDFSKLVDLTSYLEDYFNKKVDIIINSKYLNKKFIKLNEKDTLYA